MLETIREIILDFQESKWESGVKRRLDVIPVPRKAAVCIGVRRAGKSTYLFQVMDSLVNSGVNRRNILYVNFFDDRLHPLRHGGLGEILEAYFSLYPEKKQSEKIYVFLDEIQVTPDWEPFVDRLLRTENCDVYLTGSSAQMLSREIATQMRGRAISWEVFPFSFREYLDSRRIDSEGPFSTKSRLTIQKGFDEYWEAGGFPEVLGCDRLLRIKIHQEYFGAMLFRDLIERHDISHPKAVTDLAHWLVDNTASLYSINRLTAFLKSLGHKISKAQVSEILGWFEDAFILFSVRIHDSSIARANANPKKVYCIDHSLVTSVSSGILVNSGKLLENLIFTALRRKTPNLFYYKTKGGREVDFVARHKDRSRSLIQVCESIVDPDTRKRETTALSEAMKELKIKEGCIVTQREEETLETEAGTIHVKPAWRFLLDQDPT